MAGVYQPRQDANAVTMDQHGVSAARVYRRKLSNDVSTTLDQLASMGIPTEFEEEEEIVFEPWSGDPPSVEQIQAAVQTLDDHKQEWALLPLEEKIIILKEMQALALQDPVSWATCAAEVKGMDEVESVVAQELLSTSMLLSNTLAGVLKTLEHLHKKKHCPQLAIKSLLSGQQTIQVFPLGWGDSLNFSAMQGFQVELFLQPGKPATLCSSYQGQHHRGRVVVIVGAGHQGYVSLGEVLYYMFNLNCSVLLKYHPFQAPYAEYAEKVLEPLRERGFYWSMVCDEQELAHTAIYHPLTEMVHISGTRATHDLLVWGRDAEEQAQRKATGDPLIKVPVFSQLQCVTPYIMVPGPWNEDEVEHHVRQLVAAFADNNSLNQMTPRVVLVAGDWDKTEEIIERFKDMLTQFPMLPAFYPGMHSRYQAFLRQYPEAEAIESPMLEGSDGFGPLLPYIVNVLDKVPDDPQEEYCFQVDPFCPCITFVKLWADEEEEEANFEVDFLQDAVDLVNSSLYGSTSCTVAVHPATEEMYKDAVVAQLHRLRYGCVCVNGWSNIGYFPQMTVWGSFGGLGDLKEPGSGLGHVRNSYMYDHIQKAHVYTPFLSSMHAQPFTHKRTSIAAARSAVGLHTHGVIGLFKGLWKGRGS